MQPLKKEKKKVNVMYTPKFSLSFTLLFSFLFIILQSLADISTMLIYARHSTRYTYTFFSYATCEWPEIFIQNKVLFCSVLFHLDWWNLDSNGVILGPATCWSRSRRYEVLGQIYLFL